MSTCINRHCVLKNLAFNLAVNNIISGVVIFLQSNGEEFEAFAMLSLAALLIIGLLKKNRTLLLTFLILEPFLLFSELWKKSKPLVHHSVDGVKLFDALSLVGIVVSLLLLYPVYLIYKDLAITEVRIVNECKSNNGENEISKDEPV